MIRVKWLYLALILLAASVTLTLAHAQGIPVVGGGSLSYVRPSAPIQCGNMTGAVYNFYGYVYFNNGTEYGISTGGTFWHSLNCPR